ncbi:hypothetical protein B0A48_00364 [Cryoendolithus antarcticus]|uniref:G domain-containing protein n=1 Tax=Cryoendolithus antarcticus TaxID=1507870 RepID=A0A1V8TUW6_9PEZI|nr:hypothetical protein B0A48_00364 [Cryoendolithus antarcticus]
MENCRTRRHSFQSNPTNHGIPVGSSIASYSNREIVNYLTSSFDHQPSSDHNPSGDVEIPSHHLTATNIGHVPGSTVAIQPSQAKVNPRNFRDQHEPRENDVFVAVMGVTGAGKSTFISKLTTKEIKIGHEMQACTQDVAVFLCKYFDDVNVYLVDTPGFDDTDRSDADILREIASWLTTSYANSIKLHGIIYLHRITDIRMQGSAKNNLIMFKKLCGHNALKNVILATTMWERVREPDGVERERQLKTKQEFWGYMIDNGSQLHRHKNTQDSALQLIGSLVSRQAHKAKVVLDIQTEIVDHGKSLSDTAAGQAVDNAVAQERNKIAKELAHAQADMKQALAEKDRGTAEVLRQHSEEMNAKMRKLDREHSALKVTMERMQDERFAKMQKALEQAEQESKKYREAMAAAQANAEREATKAREAMAKAQAEAERESKRAREATAAAQAKAERDAKVMFDKYKAQEAAAAASQQKKAPANDVNELIAQMSAGQISKDDYVQGLMRLGQQKAKQETASLFQNDTSKKKLQTEYANAFQQELNTNNKLQNDYMAPYQHELAKKQAEALAAQYQQNPNMPDYYAKEYQKLVDQIRVAPGAAKYNDQLASLEQQIKNLSTSSVIRTRSHPVFTMTEWPVTASFWGDKFYFVAKNTDLWQVVIVDDEFPKARIAANNGNRCVTLGPNKNWYIHYHDEVGTCWTERSDEFLTTYPEAEEYMKSKQQYGCPTCVSLGPNANYFIRTAWGASHKLPADATAHLVNIANVEKFYFGKNGAWVALKYDGSRSWDLKGQYGNLADYIKEGINGETRVHLVAMNPEDASQWVIIWKNGLAAYSIGSTNVIDSFELEEWCTKNLGTKWGS